MAKFKKKLALIEARQFVAGVDAFDALFAWFDEWGVKANGDDNGIMITSSDLVMMARPGDWIIRNASGEFYPCKSDVFAATYEPDDTRPDLVRLELTADDAITVVGALNLSAMVRVTMAPVTDAQLAGADADRRLATVFTEAVAGLV